MNESHWNSQLSSLCLSESVLSGIVAIEWNAVDWNTVGKNPTAIQRDLSFPEASPLEAISQQLTIADGIVYSLLD